MLKVDMFEKTLGSHQLSLFLSEIFELQIELKGRDENFPLFAIVDPPNFFLNETLCNTGLAPQRMSPTATFSG